MDDLIRLTEVLAILYKAKQTDIDAEEEVRKLSDAVVRCKDCKWMDYIYGKFYCDQGNLNGELDETDYCSRWRWRVEE